VARPLAGKTDRVRLSGVPTQTRRKPMQFCDLKCKHADWPDKLSDGSGSCRTFVGLWCKLKKKIVHKNAPCADKQAR
jgi:hypothetical protein